MRIQLRCPHGALVRAAGATDCVTCQADAAAKAVMDGPADWAPIELPSYGGPAYCAECGLSLSHWKSCRPSGRRIRRWKVALRPYQRNPGDRRQRTVIVWTASAPEAEVLAIKQLDRETGIEWRCTHSSVEDA